MNLIEGAVNRRNNDWVEKVSVLWESEGVEAFNEASTAITERAEEDEVGDFAHEAVGDAKEAGKEDGFGIGCVAVVAGEDPNNEDEKDRKDNAPVTF